MSGPKIGAERRGVRPKARPDTHGGKGLEVRSGFRAAGRAAARCAAPFVCLGMWTARACASGRVGACGCVRVGSSRIW